MQGISCFSKICLKIRTKCSIKLTIFDTLRGQKLLFTTGRFAIIEYLFEKIEHLLFTPIAFTVG